MSTKIRPELQVTPLESGLCCSAMLLHAHGSRRPTAELREELDLGRNGSSLDQLAELFTARSIPVEMQQRTAEEALRNTRPFIVTWGSAGYVIVEKVRKSTLVLVDPAIGRRTAPLKEFEQNFSGFCLEPDFATDKVKEGPVSRDHPQPFRAAMKKSAGPLTGVVIASLLVYVTDIAAPLMIQRVIDKTITHPGTPMWVTFLPWIALISGTIALGIFLRSFFISGSAVRIGRSTSEAVLDHLLGLPFRYFDSRQPGELAYRLGGLSTIRDMLSDQLFTGFFQIGGVAVYLGYMFHSNVILGSVSAFFVAAMLAVLFGSRKLFYSAIQNELSQTGRMQTEQLEAIQSILTIKTRPDNSQFLGRWRRQNEVSLGYLRRRMLLQGGVGAMIGILQFSGPMVTLLAGIGLWRQGDISLGVVFAALTVSSLLFATASGIYGSVAIFLICRTFARRVEDITMTERVAIGTRKTTSLVPLEVQGVSFQYTQGTPNVLDDISLTVSPGQTVAIVGHTGSGKSTLAKLLMGLYQPGEGLVSYGGIPVGELAPKGLFERLSFVPQDVTLETATLHENVALGREVSREEVERACRIACVHDDIMGFPAGYDMMVNNLGANLSGGQRQRVALARAVLNEPEVLVLDEATSSLDSITEVDITSNLRALGCTTIVIAHRLASVVDADVTYVMRKGRIVESGRHCDLMDMPSAYRELFAGQSAA
jgi:ABC-type bacteriocin/lantibiotic exporter with double-glycine peptidase domain